MKKILTLGLAAAGLLSAPALTQAVTIYGLTTSNQLVRFDSAAPGTILSSVTINDGASTPAPVPVVDLDFYPVNGLLYAFNAAGLGYRVNLTTGVASLVTTPGTALTGNVVAVDFNPAADRLRVFTDANQNYRITQDVETNNTVGFTPGAVSSDGAFTSTTGALPVTLVGAAYTNNVDGAGSAGTTLYSIDTASDRLILHTVAPQFSTVESKGNLNVAGGVGTAVGFDIEQGTNTAYLSNGSALYTVNLGDGSTTSIGTVGVAGLKSIAVVAVPEPTSALLAGFGLVGALGARRRRPAL